MGSWRPGPPRPRLNLLLLLLLLLTIEDLIVDWLRAAKFWASQTDHEQAQLLYAAHRDRLDTDRLRSRAEQERVADLLDGLEAG